MPLEENVRVWRRFGISDTSFARTLNSRDECRCIDSHLIDFMKLSDETTRLSSKGFCLKTFESQKENFSLGIYSRFIPTMKVSASRTRPPKKNDALLRQTKKQNVDSQCLLFLLISPVSTTRWCWLISSLTQDPALEPVFLFKKNWTFRQLAQVFLIN